MTSTPEDNFFQTEDMTDRTVTAFDEGDARPQQLFELVEMQTETFDTQTGTWK